MRSLTENFLRLKCRSIYRERPSLPSDSKKKVGDFFFSIETAGIIWRIIQGIGELVSGSS